MTTAIKLSLSAGAAALVGGVAVVLVETAVVSPPPERLPVPELMSRSGTGFVMSWGETDPPYRIKLSWPKPGSTDALRTTIPCPYPGYAWVNLKMTTYTAEVVDVHGDLVHQETFEPVDVINVMSVRQTNMDILEVSDDLVTWRSLPRGYTYQTSPSSQPKMFFRFASNTEPIPSL